VRWQRRSADSGEPKTASGGETTARARRRRGCSGTQAWLSGASAGARTSGVRHMTEQRLLSVSDGEEEK
jgi:hypothetical protein